MFRKKRIIIDAGFIIALWHDNDQHHELAVETEARLGDSYQWVSTIFVIQEICCLLRQRVGYQSVLNFMEMLSNKEIELPSLPNNWLVEAYTIMERYKNRKLDLADASIVILADMLQLGTILSVDIKDFRVLRWKKGFAVFDNLMDVSC